MNIDVDLMLTITAGILLSFLIRHLATAALAFFMGSNSKGGYAFRADAAPRGVGDAGRGRSVSARTLRSWLRDQQNSTTTY